MPPESNRGREGTAAGLGDGSPTAGTAARAFLTPGEGGLASRLDPHPTPPPPPGSPRPKIEKLRESPDCSSLTRCHTALACGREGGDPPTTSWTPEADQGIGALGGDWGFIRKTCSRPRKKAAGWFPADCPVGSPLPPSRMGCPRP